MLSMMNCHKFMDCKISQSHSLANAILADRHTVKLEICPFHTVITAERFHSAVMTLVHLRKLRICPYLTAVMTRRRSKKAENPDLLSAATAAPNSRKKKKSSEK